MNPLFYAVRRITRGPRGAVKHTEVVRTTITSRDRALTFAKDCKAHSYSWQDVEVVGIYTDKDKIVVEPVWSSRG